MRNGMIRRRARRIVLSAAGCACAAGLAFAVGCASAGPPLRSGTAADTAAAAADSIENASLEDIFAARHASLAERIEALESSSSPDPRVIEARAILTEAENAYLLGRISLALKLLDGVEEVLRQGS